MVNMFKYVAFVVLLIEGQSVLAMDEAALPPSAPPPSKFRIPGSSLNDYANKPTAVHRSTSGEEHSSPQPQELFYNGKKISDLPPTEAIQAAGRLFDTSGRPIRSH